MIRTRSHLLLSVALVVACTGLYAQSYDDRLSAVLGSASGSDRAGQLVELARMERERGRLREAVEFAIQGASEAEKNHQDNELAAALMELAKAHEQKGDLDQAIGISLRTTLIEGAHQSGLRTTALLNLAELYLKAGYPQKSLEHLNDAYATAPAGKLDADRAMVLEARSRSFIMPPDALVKHLVPQIAAADRNGSAEARLLLRSLLVTALARSGRHEEAYATELEVMDLAVRTDNVSESAISTNNQGELLQRMGRFEESNTVFAKGLILCEEQPRTMVDLLINAAHAQAKAGNHPAALRSLKEARSKMQQCGYKAAAPRLYRTGAVVDLLRNDLAAALAQAQAAQDAATQLKDLQEQAASCELLANILDRRQQSAEAREQLQKAHDLVQQYNRQSAEQKMEREAHLLRLQRIEREQAELINREQRKESKLRQMALDAENREKQLALLGYEKELEEAARREASLAKDRAEKGLQLAEAALEAERRERTIQDLDHGRMLQTLSVSKLELEQKEQLRTVELLQRQNELVVAERRAIEAQQQRDHTTQRMSIMLAVAALLMAGGLGWAWQVTRRKKRYQWHQNQRMEAINAQLLEKTHNIESSLRYAQTIQSAILPKEEDLRAVFQDSFLLYKPLDQVSGDLPYVRTEGDVVHVAAIDCTGHGVPAAMMTFIAYYALNDLIAQDPRASCGQLLDRLHLHVKATMEARGCNGIYNDGMDIGLCRLDRASGEVNFAGAQQSIIHLSQGVAHRLKGDALPLGDMELERRGGYGDQYFQMEPGDTLLLFSDGLVHQFGGEDGQRKFSMKQLMGIAEAHAFTPLAGLKHITDQAFADWMGEGCQTDDVLLIGLRRAA